MTRLKFLTLNPFALFFVAVTAALAGASMVNEYFERNPVGLRWGLDRVIRC